MNEDAYGSDCEQAKQEAMRFAQCLRGHPALIVLLPATWRYGSVNEHTGAKAKSGSWYDERGKRVPKEEVMSRLESRLIDLYSFYPTPAEVKYIHDDLLVPLYSADALSRFLHTFLYPDPKGSVPLADVWQVWSNWKHRTTATEAALLNHMSGRRLRMVDGALLGWEWRKPVKRKAPAPIKVKKPLTRNQERTRQYYDEAVRLGIAVPGNMKKSCENLMAHRAAQSGIAPAVGRRSANATPPCVSDAHGGVATSRARKG